MRDGLSSWCAACHREATRRWRGGHREEINEARRVVPRFVYDPGAGGPCRTRRRSRSRKCGKASRPGRNVSLRPGDSARHRVLTAAAGPAHRHLIGAPTVAPDPARRRGHDEATDSHRRRRRGARPARRRQHGARARSGERGGGKADTPRRGHADHRGQRHRWRCGAAVLPRRRSLELDDDLRPEGKRGRRRRRRGAPEGLGPDRALLREQRAAVQARCRSPSSRPAFPRASTPSSARRSRARSSWARRGSPTTSRPARDHRAR